MTKKWFNHMPMITAGPDAFFVTIMISLPKVQSVIYDRRPSYLCSLCVLGPYAYNSHGRCWRRLVLCISLLASLIWQFVSNRNCYTIAVPELSKHWNRWVLIGKNCILLIASGRRIPICNPRKCTTCHMCLGLPYVRTLKPANEARACSVSNIY